MGPGQATVRPLACLAASLSSGGSVTVVEWGHGLAEHLAEELLELELQRSGTEDGAQESEDASSAPDATGDADDEGTEDGGEESEDPDAIEGCDDDEDTDENEDGDEDAGDEEEDASQGEDPVTQSAATLTRRV